MKEYEYYEKNKAVDEFKNDLFIELGIENNQKKDKLFEIAWNWGHSYGYYEVKNVAEELVELIKD